jgi:hypothetical protein
MLRPSRATADAESEAGPAAFARRDDRESCVSSPAHMEDGGFPGSISADELCDIVEGNIDIFQASEAESRHPIPSSKGIDRLSCQSRLTVGNLGNNKTMKSILTSVETIWTGALPPAYPCQEKRSCTGIGT